MTGHLNSGVRVWASAQTHEAILTQRLHDLEARDVFAHMGGYHMRVPGQTQEETEPGAVLL